MLRASPPNQALTALLRYLKQSANFLLKKLFSRLIDTAIVSHEFS